MSKISELEGFIPRPENKPRKRTTVTLEPETYEKIGLLAEELKASPGKVVTALLTYYEAGK